jgi:molybdenum cofactor synthesis domain-containing protein
LAQHCLELGWTVVVQKAVADKQFAIAAILRSWADRSLASLIMTTGGTGIAPRDVTPEATRRVLNRELPGMAELMRVRGLEQTRFSVLSRALAGVRKQSLIINLPGSPAGALHSFRAIEDLVPHVVDLLKGRTEHGNETRNIRKASQE